MARTFNVDIPDPRPGEKCTAYVLRAGTWFHDLHYGTPESLAAIEAEGHDHELRHMTDSVAIKALARWCDFNCPPMRL